MSDPTKPNESDPKEPSQPAPEGESELSTDEADKVSGGIRRTFNPQPDPPG